MMRFFLLVVVILWGSMVLAKDAQDQLIQIARQAVPVVQTFSGYIEAIKKATMTAQTTGRLAEIYFDVDDIVSKGDVLARFRNKKQKAELDLAVAGFEEAKAEYERSQAESRRFDDLFKRQLVAKSALEQATAALKSADARLKAASAKINNARENYEYTVIRAPYSGIVTKRHVEVGESVNPGSPLVSGISLDALRLVVDVPQAFVETVRQNKQALVYLSDQRVIRSNQLTVFPFADEVSHSFRVRVDIPEGTQGLYPGMLVRVGFIAGERQALVIPRQAMVHRGEMLAVYVKNPDGRIVMRQIRRGAATGTNHVIVDAGLVAGEQVFLDPLSATVALKQAAEKNNQ